MRTLIYMVNNTSQTSPTDISFGNVIREYGLINPIGGNVSIRDTGYFDIDTNFVFVSGGTAGNVTIQLTENGNPIPGAVATVTMGTTGTTSVSIPAIVKRFCKCNETIIGATITGSATVNTATIKVEKV